MRTTEPHPLIDGIQITKWDRSQLERVRAGGLDAIHATAAVWEDARRTLDRIAAWNRLFAENADLIRPATCGADIDRAVEEGRTAVILGFQNTAPLEDDPRLVEVFHRLGVRVIQLTYNVQNLVGGSCYQTEESGLTRFGAELISEMNRLRVLIDCSHVGNRTTLDAIDASAAPIAITHANPLSFCDSPRNKPDHVLKELAARGGVLGLTLYPLFIGGPDTALEDFATMALDTVDKLGIEHVAIGTDSSCGWSDHDLVDLRHGRLLLDPPPARWPQWPQWYEGPEHFARLRDELAHHGFDDEHLAALFGGTWRRFLGQVLGEEND
jgi:membrane dipeptidase